MYYSSHRYPAGHVFFEEGTAGTSAHIIKSGQVEIIIRQGDKEILIDVFGPGEIFGEMALLGTKTRTATARAIEQTAVINISRARLLNVLRHGDPILRHLVLTFVNRLKRANTKIRPDKADNMALSVCRILALTANQNIELTDLTDEHGNTLLPYTMAIEQVRGILSIDATDCRAVLERLETFNLIEIIENQASTDKFIRFIDEEHFLEKAERASQELGSALSSRLFQRSIYIDLFDFSEQIEVERERIYKKIAEGQFPEEFLLFKSDDVLKWAEEVGPSFFEAKRKRISADELDTLDDIVHVRNSILRTVLNQMDFYKICQLLKTAAEPVKDKMLSNLSGRLKQVVEQELDLIEEVDADEVEEVTEDLLEETRDLMEAEKQARGVGKKSRGAEDADAEPQSEE
ncbi:MAG: cyclic nucleotide-binding domain-containing protein [Candidatus Poribacteria bacterium]|nr:cyclic nucleotide-binding domain-containing protein [Candidatus Poribacteria bacterium]